MARRPTLRVHQVRADGFPGVADRHHRLQAHTADPAIHGACFVTLKNLQEPPDCERSTQFATRCSNVSRSASAPSLWPSVSATTGIGDTYTTPTAGCPTSSVRSGPSSLPTSIPSLRRLPSARRLRCATPNSPWSSLLAPDRRLRSQLHELRHPGYTTPQLIFTKPCWDTWSKTDRAKGRPCTWIACRFLPPGFLQGQRQALFRVRRPPQMSAGRTRSRDDNGVPESRQTEIMISLGGLFFKRQALVGTGTGRNQDQN